MNFQCGVKQHIPTPKIQSKRLPCYPQFRFPEVPGVLWLSLPRCLAFLSRAPWIFQGDVWLWAQPHLEQPRRESSHVELHTALGWKEP